MFLNIGISSYSFTFKAAENLRQLWEQGDYTQRQELQAAFFSERISYNRQKDECRLGKPNYFLEHVADLSGEMAKFTPEQIKNFDPTSEVAHRAKSRTIQSIF